MRCIAYFGLHVKFPIFSPDFEKKLISSTDFHVAPKYQISQKIRRVTGALIHADGRTCKRRDGRTYMAKRIDDFGDYAKAPK